VKIPKPTKVFLS